MAARQPERPEALVGLDVGTSGVKAIAISAEGEILARAEEHYPSSSPQPGWSEQDPEDWAGASERALQRLGVRPLGLGLSGQMHGLVCLDAGERVLRPAILWDDQRTAPQCEVIERTVGLRELIDLTANRALPGFTAPKLLWMREHEPETYARIAHVLLPKDYVRLRLTGTRATDVADASGTLMFDVRARRWSERLLDALDLDDAWLPPALESPARSAQTPDGVPVAAGAGDQAAAALGVGVDRPGPLSVVLGTSGVVFAALPRFARDDEGRAHVFCHAVPGTWHAMGVMLSAAASLEWVRRVVGPTTPYETLLAEAQEQPPGARGVQFAPYLTGERTPHADPDARGAFVGLSAGGDRGALGPAVLEGVAYGLRDSLAVLDALGVRPERARISGGGARSALWAKIVASVLRVTIGRPGAEEGSAFGAALLAGVSAGVHRDVGEAVAACVRTSETVEPDPRWVQAYDEGYERFGRLYPALRTIAGSAAD